MPIHEIDVTSPFPTENGRAEPSDWISSSTVTAFLNSKYACIFRYANEGGGSHRRWYGWNDDTRTIDWYAYLSPTDHSPIAVIVHPFKPGKVTEQEWAQGYLLFSGEIAKREWLRSLGHWPLISIFEIAKEHAESIETRNVLDKYLQKIDPLDEDIFWGAVDHLAKNIQETRTTPTGIDEAIHNWFCAFVYSTEMHKLDGWPTGRKEGWIWAARFLVRYRKVKDEFRRLSGVPAHADQLPLAGRDVYDALMRTSNRPFQMHTLLNDHPLEFFIRGANILIGYAFEKKLREVLVMIASEA